MDLFVRAGRNDNRVVEELVAPASAGVPFGGRRVPMHALVVDAPTAAAQPALRLAAQAAGLPLIVDPLTNLFQDEQAPESSWAKLDFADPAARSAHDFADPAALAALVERSLTFQLEHGASILIPPYFHAKSSDDSWFGVQLAANRATARYLIAEQINLPIAAVFAGSLKTFGSRRSWATGIDEFVRSLGGLNIRYLPVALSSSRSPNGDTEDRLAAYLATMRHVGAAAPVVAWRQGQYGLAAVAAGAVGYQTGFATDERCDLTSFARSRRPKPPPEPGGGPQMTKRIYLSGFGRSISRQAAEILLGSGYLRGTLTCTDTACCPNGGSSMTSDWRQHAIRSRSRELHELSRMPDDAWRLNHVGRLAERAADDARAANELLTKAEVAERIPEASFRSLATVMDALRDISGRRAG